MLEVLGEASAAVEPAKVRSPTRRRGQPINGETFTAYVEQARAFCAEAVGAGDRAHLTRLKDRFTIRLRIRLSECRILTADPTPDYLATVDLL